MEIVNGNPSPREIKVGDVFSYCGEFHMRISQNSYLLSKHGNVVAKDSIVCVTLSTGATEYFATSHDLLHHTAKMEILSTAKAKE